MPKIDKKNYSCPQNIYIIKPGEETNRGFGITVVDSLH